MKAALKAYVLRSEIIFSLLVVLHNAFYRNMTRVSSGNKIVNHGALLKRCVIRVSGINNTIEFGRGVRLVDAVISIDGDHHLMRIGLDCAIRKSGFYLAGRGNRIVIDECTTVEGADFSAGDVETEITIGSDCMFSQQIEVRTCDAHSIIDSASGKRINPSQSVAIGRHVWVGSGSKILKGCCIGDNAIIATGAIVTKAVEEGTVVAGVPARVVRRGITWCRERIAVDSSLSKPQ
jgi:acetyltransferase-like isoleucine patch superfamily enzyme